MANQPKVTKDPEQDSWAFQVTRELNDLQSKVQSVRDRIIALDNTATLADLIEILEDL